MSYYDDQRHKPTRACLGAFLSLLSRACWF